jgi:hypothetical protein
MMRMIRVKEITATTPLLRRQKTRTSKKVALSTLRSTIIRKLRNTTIKALPQLNLRSPRPKRLRKRKKLLTLRPKRMRRRKLRRKVVSQCQLRECHPSRTSISWTVE